MISSRNLSEIENVRLRIKSEMYARDPDKTFIVAFVGATRKAGTTTMAVAVAQAFHQAEMRGKTLLLSMSGHGKSVEKIARVSHSKTKQNDDTATGSVSAGNSNAIGTNTETNRDKPAVLQKITQSKGGFDVLSVSDDAEMRRLFEPNNPFWPEVLQRYGVTFVDTGTVGSEPHMAAATKADMVLLVVDGKKITRSELARLRERLDQAKLMPDGVVLNRKRDYLPRIFRAAVE